MHHLKPFQNNGQPLEAIKELCSCYSSQWENRRATLPTVMLSSFKMVCATKNSIKNLLEKEDLMKFTKWKTWLIYSQKEESCSHYELSLKFIPSVTAGLPVLTCRRWEESQNLSIFLFFCVGKLTMDETHIWRKKKIHQLLQFAVHQLLKSHCEIVQQHAGSWCFLKVEKPLPLFPLSFLFNISLNIENKALIQ